MIFTRGGVLRVNNNINFTSSSSSLSNYKLLLNLNSFLKMIKKEIINNNKNNNTKYLMCIELKSLKLY